MELSEITEILRNIIKAVTGIIIEDDNNLLDEMAAYDLLYLVEPIEKTFGLSIKILLKNSDYRIMTVNELANRIWEARYDENSIS